MTTEGTNTAIRPRYEYLDILRGCTLISMILYHAMWDLAYIVRIQMDWFRGKGAYIWQQSICWTFILLAGFCWSLGRTKWKRGSIVFGAGMLVTLVTVVATPGQRIVFGVLTLLGSSMLLMIPAEKQLRRIPAIVGVLLFGILFLLCKEINQGYLGIGELVVVRLPKEWYECGYFMTYLGFTDKSFFSTDYFSLMPWFFLFVTGYFIYRLAAEKGWMQAGWLGRIQCRPLAWIGRHSLLIYLLHQPILYLVFTVDFW